MSDRVLLIGKRAAVLTRLRTALSRIGVAADISQDVANTDAQTLRGYRVVAFGRAVTPADRERTKAAFSAANADADADADADTDTDAPAEVAYVDGLAPITPLLIAQIEAALDRRPTGQRRIADCVVADAHVRIELRHRAHLTVTAHTLSRLYRAREHDLLDESLPAGPTSVALPPNVAAARAAFVVVRADQGEVRVLSVAAVP